MEPKSNIINNSDNHICIILKNNHLLDFIKELFIFWNCVYLLMKFHEFEVISLCYEILLSCIIFFITFKIKCVFYYSNFHQMFSSLLFVNNLIRMAKCVDPLRCTCIQSFEVHVQKCCWFQF